MERERKREKEEEREREKEIPVSNIGMSDYKKQVEYSVFNTYIFKRDFMKEKQIAQHNL